MSRRQKPGGKKNDWEEVDLDTMGDQAEPSAADEAYSYQNHMLIYNEDIDDMLDELDEDQWDVETLSTGSANSRTISPPPSPLGYRGGSEPEPLGAYRDYPEPPRNYHTPPGCRRIQDDNEPNRRERSPSPPVYRSAVPPTSTRSEVSVGQPQPPPPPSTPTTPRTPSPPGEVILPSQRMASTAPSRRMVVEDDMMIAVPRSPVPIDDTMPKLMGTRAPMSRPVPIRQHGERSIQKSSKLSKIKELLAKGKKGAEEVFDILIRSVKLNKKDATIRILSALELSDEDLCDSKYREKESTASLLHVALLYQRTELCQQLIRKFPGLLKVKYTSEDYSNQTCFHIAAANDERGWIIHYMLSNLTFEEKHELLNTIADGSYFVDERPEAATCLSAAVWTGQVGMIRTLVEAGADLDLSSIDGNTLLHFIIYLSTTGLDLQKAKACVSEVYMCCDVWWMRRHKKDASKVKGEGQHDQMRSDAFCHLLGIRNDSGLIPLALAVSVHSPLTPFLLSFEPIYKLPQVKFGAVAWATYDVTDILSFKPDPGQKSIANYDGSSVFHILAHTKRVLSESSHKQTDIAELEPINTAIEMKWSVYRWIYVLWCLVHAIYMVSLTSVVLDEHYKRAKDNATNLTTTTPPSNNSSATQKPSSSGDNNNALMGIFVIIPAIYVIFEFVDLLVSWLGYGIFNVTNIGPKKRKNKLLAYLANNCTITGNAPYRLLAFCFSVCIFAWYAMRMQGDTNSDIPLSLALILGWIFMLNFTRACRHVCRFSIMIQKMFFRDFLYFLTVYMFILIAFSSALHLILPPGHSVTNTIVGLLNIVTNAGEAEEEGEPTQKHYAEAVLSMYAILSVILLLNMLIAMMNTSYEAVKSSKTNLWRYQQLSILLMFERRFIWWSWLCRRSQAETKRITLPLFGGGQHSRIFLDVTEEKMKS